MSGKVAEDDPTSIGWADLVGGAGRPSEEVEPKMTLVREGNMEV